MYPNLFLLGAGKCGTTSLHHLLGCHPDIHACTPKEPSFFCSYFQVIADPITYFSLFHTDTRYRVDASHVYFSNPETPPILKGLFPQARFIVILRDPKRRAYSLYQHMRRAQHADGQPIELSESFADALFAEDDRFASPAFFQTCRHYFYNFMYVRSSLFDLQIDRYLSLFPRDQFLFLSLAELKNQPQTTREKLAAFLDISPNGFGDTIPDANRAPAYAPYDPASDAFLTERFAGLTDRVETMIGQRLDWSC